MHSQAPARAPRHVPALDGVRAIAVLTVLVAHGSVRLLGPENRWGSGGLGVQIFFVLSGYLITTLLLAEHRQHGRISLKDFYIRRGLRIWPLYYAVLLLYVVVLPRIDAGEFGNVYVSADRPGFDEWVGHWWAYAFFLQNYLTAVSEMKLGLGIFWSLAVEEQYYIFWPLVLIALLRLRRRFAVPAALLLVLVASTVARWLTLEGRLPEPANPEWMLHTGLTGLVCGTLLAWLRHDQGHRTRGWADGLPGYVVAWMVLALVTLSTVPDSTTFGFRVTLARFDYYQPLLVGLLVATIIDRLVSVPSSGRLLALPPLRYVGKISYGMYLLHPLVLGFVTVRLTAEDGTRGGWVGMAVFVAATVAVASVSFYAFERPILRFKSRFQRVGHDANPDATSGATPDGTPGGADAEKAQASAVRTRDHT